MKPFIFIGPTITVDEALAQLDAIYLPPVKYGDVYRITQLYQPQTIGIIDGYFNQVPSVWHKEILWAMNQGVRVYGASSMGALRAAELQTFGMMGCGQIFEAYKKGILAPYIDEAFEDDDEVAITHAPAELGYKALSEAMVNIRVTLAKAQQEQIIDLELRNTLTKSIKQQFYPERSYQAVLSFALQQGMSESQVTQLAHWIGINKTDQKKADAVTLLSRIKDDQHTPKTDEKISPSAFVFTSQWQSAINEIEASHRIESMALDEIRLQGQRYFEALEQSHSALFAHRQDNVINDVNELTSLHQSIRKLEKQLSHDWQTISNRATQAKLSSVESDQCLLNYLERTGELLPLQQRATAKLQALSGPSFAKSFELSEIDLLQLTDWYFSNVLDLEMPAHLEDYAASLGFTDMDSFYDMILREYYYKEELKKDGALSYV